MSAKTESTMAAAMTTWASRFAEPPDGPSMYTLRPEEDTKGMRAARRHRGSRSHAVLTRWWWLLLHLVRLRFQAAVRKLRPKLIPHGD